VTDTKLSHTTPHSYEWGFIILMYTQEIQRMTTWAIQPSSWGNELRSWAEYANEFAIAEDIACAMADDFQEACTIWKCGTVSEFKWSEVKL